MSSITTEYGVGEAIVFDIEKSRENIIVLVIEEQDDSTIIMRCFGLFKESC